MGIDVADIRKRVYLRLGNYGLADRSTDELLDMYIDGVALRLAALDLDCLLRTEYLETDVNGKFSIPKVEVLPYLVFSDGIEDRPHTWRRLTPIDYLYFISWDSRSDRGGIRRSYGNLGNRYTVLPREGKDGTFMQILEAKAIKPIKVIHYPIRPHITDFPNCAKELITSLVLEQFIMDRQDSIKDRSIKLLMDDTKRLMKEFMSQVSRVEVNAYDTSVRNNKTRDWIMSEANDLSYWR